MGETHEAVAACVHSCMSCRRGLLVSACLPEAGSGVLLLLAGRWRGVCQSAAAAAAVSKCAPGLERWHAGLPNPVSVSAWPSLDFYGFSCASCVCTSGERLVFSAFCR